MRGRTGWPMLLLAGALLAAAHPAAAQEAASPSAALAGRMDPRLWPAPAWSDEAPWTAGAGVEAARPLLSLRGMAIGGAVGCAAGALSTLVSGERLSGGAALGNAAVWCLFFWLPGTVVGGLFLD